MIRLLALGLVAVLASLAGAADVVTELRAKKTPEAQCAYAKTICQGAAEAMKASSVARARVAEEESSQNRTNESVEKARTDAHTAEREATGKHTDALLVVGELRSGDSKKLDNCGKACLAIMGTNLP